MYELFAMPAIARKTAALAIGILLAVGAARSAHAQPGVPQPPPLGAYYWSGPSDGSGNGDAGDWNNWNGRYIIDAGSPPTITRLPPQDGDTLIIDHGFNHEDVAHTISLGGLDLPSSGIEFSYYATFSGGSLNVGSVGIRSMNNVVGATFPVTFDGTSFNVNAFGANTDNDTMTFSGVDITAGEMQLSGSYSLDPVNFPPPGGTPIINIVGATVNASTITIAQNSPPGDGRFVTNVTDSQIQSLGMEIGLGGKSLDDAAEVNLYSSQATIDQYLLIGSEGGGRLRLNDQSTVTLSGANSYVNVGQEGEGDLLVTQQSTLTTNLLNIGVAERGTMTVNQGGRVFSQSGALGVLVGVEGNVTLADDALWHTNDLTVGGDGTGFVYIYDQATLRIDGTGILGDAQGSRGVLNLIGPGAKLELGPTGTLTIGEEGDGELNLSAGATFTSSGDVNLGAIEGSSGIVTVDGQDGPSTWTVSGALNIGVRSVGRVELNNGGKLTFTGTEIVLGSEPGGDGTLVLDGQNSTIESNGVFVVGRQSNGTLRIDNGAVYSAKNIVVGEQAGSEGLIEIMNSNQTGNTKFTVTESIQLGEMGNGTLTIQQGASVAVGVGDTTELLTFDLGVSTGGAGQLTVTGSGSSLTTASLGQGSGSATVVIEDGGSIAANAFEIGGTAGGMGQATVAGTNSSVVVTLGSATQANGFLGIGQSGQGTLEINAGATASAPFVLVGEHPGGVGQISVDGAQSSLQVTQILSVGTGYVPSQGLDVGPVGGMGTIQVSTGGSVTVGQQLAMGNGGTVSLDGGGVMLVGSGALPATPDTLLIAAGGTFSGTGTISANVVFASSSNSTYNGAIVDATGGASHSLTLTGSAGTLALGGANTFSGGTTITAGILNINADAALGALPTSPSTNLVFDGAAPGGALQFATGYAGGTLSANRGITVSTGSTGNIDTNGNDISWGGLLSDSGGFAKSGGGTLEIGRLTLGDQSTLAANAGTLKLNVASASTIGLGVTAAVATGATLELAGSVSALGAATGARVHIVNKSLGDAGAAAGLVVSGMNQVVGGIDGLGTTQVNDGSDLTADHIIQSSLVIDDGATFTLAPSDASGNPMATTDELILAGSLTPSSSFIADGHILIGAGVAAASSSSVSLGGASAASLSVVPEPATSTLALFALPCIWLVRRRFIKTQRSNGKGRP